LDWQRALALDRAMSALAGQPVPGVEDALQRLVNERLVLRLAQREGVSATVGQAEARLMALLARWGASEAQLSAALGEVGLDRAEAVEAIHRLLIVEAYLTRFESAELASRWLSEQRRQAKVSVYVDLASQAEILLPSPTAHPPATPLVLAPSAAATVPLPPTLASATAVPPTPQALPDNVAPDFTLPDLKGQPVSLSRFRGKVVVMKFWASWCPACRAETPDFIKFTETHAPLGIVVLGVNLREDAGAVRAFAEDNSINYPLLLDSQGEVATRYQVVGIPTTVVIDPAGGVHSRHVGRLSAEQLAASIRPLLTRSSPAFTLPREDGRQVALSDYVGRQSVVLVFYRGAGCGACQQQLRALQSEYPRIRARSAEVLAVAVQSVTQAAIVRDLGQLDFPVLADERGEVSRLFGVFDRFQDGLAGPAVFIIDRAGQIVWSYIGGSGDGYPPVDQIARHLP
jgi:peroxiredoxin